MPTYEYDCTECGKRVEFFQSMSAPPKQKCPSCGAARGLKRRIGAGAGLLFRGSGFYITDYRSDAYKQQAKKDGPPASTGSSESGESSDKKADTKTEKTSEVSSSAVKAAGS